MKKYRIKEWDVIRQSFCVWEDYFASAADAYSAIEYFGSIELITE